MNTHTFDYNGLDGNLQDIDWSWSRDQRPRLAVPPMPPKAVAPRFDGWFGPADVIKAADASRQPPPLR